MVVRARAPPTSSDPGEASPPRKDYAPRARPGTGPWSQGRAGLGDSIDEFTGVRCGIVTKRVGRLHIALAVAVLAGCSPVYTWDINTNSTPRPSTFDIGELSHTPVATVGLVAPGGLTGYNAALSHALIGALAQVSPPIRGIPAHEIVNALNDRGLAAEYGDLLAGFARSGIMERERLQRVASALGCRYVLVPGLAEINSLVLDRFEFYGLKIFRTRVTLIRAWLQLWDTQTGHILWESAGEVATASDVLRHERVVPVDEIAQKLWRRMLQRDLIDGHTVSRDALDM